MAFNQFLYSTPNLFIIFLFFSQTALRFNNKAVAQIASDMVLLLADHVERLGNLRAEIDSKNERIQDLEDQVKQKNLESLPNECLLKICLTYQITTC